MVIKINTSYAAFHDSVGLDEMFDRAMMSTELNRLFDGICSDIRHGAKTEGSLIDLNGNKVGYWNLERSED